MSFKSLSMTLALTASVTYAEHLALSQLLNLQAQMVNELDYEHTEPEISRSVERHSDHHWNELDYEHTEPEVSRCVERHSDHHWNSELDFEHTDGNTMTWKTKKIGDDAKCPTGYTKIGCCKCVLDDKASP